MKRLMMIAVVCLVGCGTSGDPICTDAYEQADSMNAKGEAPADACNVCSPDCAEMPWGFWTAGRNDSTAKREIGADADCSPSWVEASQDVDTSSICPDQFKN